MENIKLTITVQKPSGYTSTKTVVISEEVLIQVEELTTSNTDLLEKARREAEEVDVWKLRTESEALEASSFTLDDWEEIEGFAIEVYKKAYIKGRLKTN